VVKALRSGTYNQTQGTLYDPEKAGFCCLGVLKHCTSRGSVEGYPGKNSGFFSMPSSTWMDSIGAKDYDRSKDDNLSLTDFADFNDEDGLSFKEIADIVEKRVGTTD